MARNDSVEAFANVVDEKIGGVNTEATPEIPQNTDENTGGKKTAKADKVKIEKQNTGKVSTWVYIGPTIPRTALIENVIIKGTRAEVEEVMKGPLDAYPAAKRLIIPVSELADSRTKIRTPGNILSRTYADLVSAIKS